MVRRAILDRDDDLATDDEALPRGLPSASRPERDRPRWRGSGGRWLVWVGRAVIWAVVLLIGYRGVLAIVDGQGAGTTSAAPPSAVAAGFPETMADAYALEFGQVYLNFSPSTAASRGAELAEFVPPGSASELGWNGAGTEKLVSEQVAAVSVKSAQLAVVTLLARLNNAGLMELAVPVYTADGKMSVPGEPAWLPAPARATLPRASQRAGDQATETALQSQLPAFFQAYASGDSSTLARFTAPGAKIAGLRGTVTYGALDSVHAPAGGSRRQITATVSWLLTPVSAVSAIAAAPASLQMTYQMTVVYQNGGWDVASIGASTSGLTQGPP